MYPFNPEPSLWLYVAVKLSLPFMLMAAAVYWRVKCRSEHRYITALTLFAVAVLSTVWIARIWRQREYSYIVFDVSVLTPLAWIGSATAIPVVARLRNSKVGRWSFVAGFALALTSLYFLFSPAFVCYPGTEHWRCGNNLRLVSIALYNYHDVNGSLPSQVLNDSPMSWRVALLPYVDQGGLLHRYNQSHEWNSAVNTPVSSTVVNEYLCPSMPEDQRQGSYPFTAYAVPVGLGTAWDRHRGRTYSDFSDGASNTILIAEACGQQIPWAEPRDLPMPETPLGINLPGNQRHRSEGMFSSYHRGGALVVLGNGAVRFIGETTDPGILKALLTPSGGESVGEF